MLARQSLAVLKSGIDEELFSGAAYALVSKRLTGGVGTLGRLAFDPETDRVNRDTLFDAASLTKPFATATAALQLVARKIISLDDPVARWFPEYEGEELLPGAAVWHLLTHTSGLPPMPRVEAGTSDLIDAALHTPLAAAPGERYTYSDAGYIALGELTKRAGAGALPEWYGSSLKPLLHLTCSGFRPDLALPIAATSDDETLDGLPHDPLARRFGGAAGHAGLFLCISDVELTLRALLNKRGALQLPPELFERLFINQIGELGRQSLAFFTRGNELLPDATGFSEAAVGHSGFTGCFVIIDRENEAAAGLLTNAVLSAAPEAKPRFFELRRRWLSAAAQDLRLGG